MEMGATEMTIRCAHFYKRRWVFGKRMDAVGENSAAVDKSDHAGGKFFSTAACFYGPPPQRK